MCASKEKKDIYSILNIPDVKSQHKHNYDGMDRRMSNTTDVSDEEKFDANAPSGSIFDNYSKYPPEPDNYWQKFRITTIIGIITVLAPILWFGVLPHIHFQPRVSNSYHDEPLFAEEETSDTKEISDGSILEAIKDSGTEYVNGGSYHFYKGYFIYGDQKFPVKLAFAINNGELTEAYYKNVDYGTLMELGVHDNGKRLKLTGKNGLEVNLTELNGDEILGVARDKSVSLNVRLTPTSDTFAFTPVSHSSVKGLPIKGRAAGYYPDYTIKSDNNWIEAAVPEIDQADGIVLNGYGDIDYTDISVKVILLDNGQVVGRYYNSNGTKLDLNGYVDPSSGNLYIKLGHAYDSTESHWSLRPVSTDNRQGIYAYEGEWGKSRKSSRLTFSY